MKRRIIRTIFIFSLIAGGLYQSLVIPRIVQGREESEGTAADVPRGQAQVDQYYAVHAAALPTSRLPANDEERRVNDQFDQLCGQRDCAYSRLFWHRDLNTARAEAMRLSRPILALHLLGNLTDEYSCANSRFFRAVLYSNPDVAQYLRSHFVLYWKSVRPVPVVTVDYGDGLKYRQTITGNSVHYLLSSNGDPVDALPGLYAPGKFLSELTAFVENAPWGISESTRKAVQQYNRKLLREANRERAEEIMAAAQFDLESQGNGGEVTAFEAAPLTMSKSGQDLSTFRAVGAPQRAMRKVQRLMRTALNAFRTVEDPLHPASLQFIQVHTPQLSPGALEEFKKTLVADTQLNENLQRLSIHRLISDKGYDLDSLNREVYATIFKTPASDPWIGLNPTLAYNGLLNSGIVQPYQKQ